MNKVLNSSSFARFINISQNYNLWFSLANKTLNKILSKKQTNFNGKVEIFMDLNSYLQLSQIAPSFLQDSCLQDNYKATKARFSVYQNNTENSMDYVEISLLIPSTLKRLRQYQKIYNRLPYWNGYFFNYQKNKNWKFYLLKSVYFFTHKLFPPRNYKEIVNSLYSENHEGFFVLDWPWKKNQSCWFPNVSFEFFYKTYEGQNLPILREYEICLNNNFELDE